VPRSLAAAAVAVVLAASAAGAAALRLASDGGHRSSAAAPVPVTPLTAAPTTTSLPPTTLAPTTTTEPAPAALGPVALTGCPPPHHPPGPPGPGPWHPAVLVPEAALPAPADPVPWRADVAATLGKGMWIWQLGATEGGDVDRIVTRAARAGLRQLWVRVGDSKRGFYGADVLDPLVAKAHAQGLRVIAWGFPHLYDPMGDAAWTNEVLAWHDRAGNRVDGFSPDIEMATEGVALSEKRVKVYLGAVRQAAGNRLVVATVYRPTDRLWAPGAYPYAAIARYVDAFAPMVYWGCTEPGAAAFQTIARLAALRPVHLIGQAYDMGPEGGRMGAPSAAEIRRFLDVARRGGALGASFWSWQHANVVDWNALATFPWDRVPAHQ
jgi:hypothetical protein